MFWPCLWGYRYRLLGTKWWHSHSSFSNFETSVFNKHEIWREKLLCVFFSPFLSVGPMRLLQFRSPLIFFTLHPFIIPLLFFFSLLNQMRNHWQSVSALHVQQSSALFCRLVTSATKHFGSIAANQIRSYRTEQLPALLIISRSKATNEVLDAIQGMEDIYESGTFTVRCVGLVLLSVKSAWGG